MSEYEFETVVAQLSEYLSVHALEAEVEDLFHLFVEDLGVQVDVVPVVLAATSEAA